jgi:uncharacterized protein (DUF1330 family)
MPAYMVVEVDCQDLEWTANYRKHVPAIMAAHGGRYLAKPAMPEMLEGDRKLPQFVALIEFPTLADARFLIREMQIAESAAEFLGLSAIVGFFKYLAHILLHLE